MEAAGEVPAAPRAMTVERTISDGGQRLREAYQQISNLELSLVQVRPTVHELTTQECWSGLHCPATLRTTTLPNFLHREMHAIWDTCPSYSNDGHVG